MRKEDDDHRHAQEALRQASVTKHDVDQTIWLRLAQTWLNLLPSDHSWRRESLKPSPVKDTDPEKSDASRETATPRLNGRL
jgi:hypothetical protein